MESKHKSIISISEARLLLGKKANGLSDVEVENIINQLDFIATLAIRRRAKDQGH